MLSTFLLYIFRYRLWSRDWRIFSTHILLCSDGYFNVLFCGQFPVGVTLGLLSTRMGKRVLGYVKFNDKKRIWKCTHLGWIIFSVCYYTMIIVSFHKTFSCKVMTTVSERFLQSINIQIKKSNTFFEKKKTTTNKQTNCNEQN